MELRVYWHRVVKRGAKRTLELLQRKFRSFDLYKISLDGFKDRHFCVKAKGTVGDVLLIWR